MGHEFIGLVESVGSAVSNLLPGDKVVSPFTVSCGSCFYCQLNLSSRCTESLVFGSPALDGTQAQYVRVPLAETTLVKAPEGIQDEVAILMGDVFPTAYHAAANAFKEMSAQQIASSTVVVIGCGPVGLCAIINALEYKPKHLFAIDQVQSRLDLARKLGAETLNSREDVEGAKEKIFQTTSGRGADAVIELVGLSPALRFAFDVVRPFGMISSVGVHNGEVSHFRGAPRWALLLQLFTESDSMDWRGGLQQEPPTRDGSLPSKKHIHTGFGSAGQKASSAQVSAVQGGQGRLESWTSSRLIHDSPLLDHIVPLSAAADAYELFHAMKVPKVIFQAQQ